MPLTNPDLQAIVASANSLDVAFNNLKQALAAAAQMHNDDQTTIDQLKAQTQAGIFAPTVYPKLHLQNGWARGADVAGIHGTWTRTANGDGSATFAVTPDGPYQNFYLYVNLESGTRNARASKYVQIQEWEIGDESLPYILEPETNFEHTLDGMQYNGGISPLLAKDKDRENGAIITNKWRWFNITPGSSGWYTLNDVPFDRGMFGTGKRVRIVSEFSRIDHTMVHEAVTINGTRYAINRTSTAKPVPNWGNHIQSGFQIDTVSSPHPASVKVWDMEARVL